jgi:hypothetical protein
MIPDRVMVEELRGVLEPDFPVWGLAWDRVEAYTRQALLAQPLASQEAVYSTAVDGQLAYDVSPFELDEAGVPFLSVFVAGQLVLRLSLDRLLPDRPMVPLDPLQTE